MERSTLTAYLRVYDTGQPPTAIYYLDICEEQHFVCLCRASQVCFVAEEFTKHHGFDRYRLERVKPVETAS